MFLPKFLQPYLASYDLSQISKSDKEMKKEIITQILNLGDKQAIKWVFENYKDGTDTFQLPLSTDEIAVNCTNQPLENATELDYNQIKSVKVYNAETLIGKIPQNGYIVVFSSMVGDTLRVHSIALSASDCGQ